MPVIPSPKSAILKNILRSLKNRNYRLFFGGQAVSLVGTWMQQIAMSWLVYRLTNSPFLLGIVGFSSQIPTFLLSPFAGVYADRIEKRKILVITQTLSMVQAFILVFLLSTDLITIWLIILLNITLGLINGFDMTTRQAFVVEMLDDKEDLSNAIALNSMMFNSARLVGPSIAGLIIASMGETVVFLINGLSYIGVITALLKMKLNPFVNNNNNQKVLTGIKEGLNYAWKLKPIRVLLLMVSVVSLAGMPYLVLMPVFARDVLKGGADTLGFLIGSVGIGALIGAIFLASRKTIIGLGKVISRAAALFSFALIVFAFSENLVFSLTLMIAAGFSAMVQLASSNTIIQTITDDNMRGRVMSFYTMSFMGMAPLGSLAAGSLAENIGAPNTLLIGGIICLIGAGFFTFKLPELRKIMRPIYAQMGIIKEVAKGLQTSTNLRIPPQ